MTSTIREALEAAAKLTSGGWTDSSGKSGRYPSREATLAKEALRHLDGIENAPESGLMEVIDCLVPWSTSDEDHKKYAENIYKRLRPYLRCQAERGTTDRVSLLEPVMNALRPCMTVCLPTGGVAEPSDKQLRSTAQKVIAALDAAGVPYGD